MSTPTPRDVQALMELFESSDWKELDLRADGFELYLSKDPSRRRHDAPAPAPAAALHAHADAPPAARSSAVATPPAPQAVPANWVAIKAPNLGTFYRSPKPGAAPYVEIGQSVSPDTEVCLIEVMKLFTSVRAGMAGVVRQIAVQDAELVEHDQVLLYIEAQG